MVKTLPPLNALRAFEVAARHLNFSRAAGELGVTPGAVSKQVLALEDYIGARLFERLPDGLALTLEGRELRESTSPAFELLQGAFNRFSRRPPRSNVVRLSTVASFASQFLVPRLDAFEESLPGIELELLTSDRVTDLAREEVDLSIRFGAGDWDGLVSSELLPGRLVPVCRPDLQDRITGEDGSLNLGRTRLIQIFSSSEWRSWQAATGLTLPTETKTCIMEHFLVALQAVLSGQGVALLPDIIVRDALENGRLVKFQDAVPWHQTFHLAYLPNAERQSNLRAVIKWLQREAANLS